MPPWEVFLIPLIAFGAWILSTLMKSEDEKTAKRPPRRPEGAGVSRRSPSALDSFLDEARRRRAAAAGMESAPEPPKPTPQPPIIAPRRPAPATRPAVPRRPAPVLATIIDEPPIIRREVEVAKPPPALAVPKPFASSLPEALPNPPPAPLLTRDERPVSPVLLEVMRLLRSPKTVGAAIMLREILDRPYGRQRR